MTRRLNVLLPDAEVLEHLSTASRPLGLRGSTRSFVLVRETLFDTADDKLKEQRLTLRLRTEARGRSVLELCKVEAVNLQGVVEESVWETPVVDGGLYATLAGNNEVATRVRGVVDPAALRPRVALDIDRDVRDLKLRWFGGPVFRVILDRIMAHVPGSCTSLHEITIQELGPSRLTLETLGERVRTGYGAESDGRDTRERVVDALRLGDVTPAVQFPHDVRTALLILRGGEVALVKSPDGYRLPTARGSGEEVARDAVEDCMGTTSDGELELIGFAPTRYGASDLETWLHQEPSSDAGQKMDCLWMPLPELLERVGGPMLQGRDLVAPLLLLVRSEIGLRLLREAVPDRASPLPLPVPPRSGNKKLGKARHDLLDVELSILDFNLRVLELAEDPAVPLLERFFYLSIFSSNLDEFFVVRVGRLKGVTPRPGGDDKEFISAQAVLDLISVRVRALIQRQYLCLTRSLLPALARKGIRIRQWDELDEAQQSTLAAAFREEIFPLLTPHAMSAGPGQPFPRLISLGLSLACILRSQDGEHSHLAHVPIPDGHPRFLPVPGSEDLITVESVVVANAQELFPAFQLQEAHIFRVSRIGDVVIDEEQSESLLESVADEVESRAYKPVVRLEVQRSMPRKVRAHLLRELRTEQGAESRVLGRTDVYEVDGPIDLGGFSQLTGLDVEDGCWPALPPANEPIPADVRVFDVLDREDLLVFHPYDDFCATVARFLAEAAEDPDVVSIRLTLYRTGRDSPVMEALMKALESGKDVSVFVELKARFDEESNIDWTHRLKEAGAHVVFGIAGFKTHAKTALVVRRQNGNVRRYVHVGTGNYNAATARFYTDLGLMSADPDLGADLNDFFNELTGGAGPPSKEYRRLWVAPHSLRQPLKRLIDREIEHAEAGRPARIRAKLNGLSDKKVIRRLYEASQAGVEIDLTVRAICTLRPGVEGLSDGITVRSILGRFLEHARIYYFENAGQTEYYIGSADWRARNLRRRVEVVAPVDDVSARERLEYILSTEAEDPRQWVLRPDGVYERRQGAGEVSQERFLREWGR